ncbi:hypothetical protein PVAND_013406 [Polypedilum vanderplanki]|uniref:Odorant receptor n=1 Tax=Polypedilum vanderplanki TaxID=319348 RepID=A0A9J6CQ87_POLVA|nr:hypothetical protein PVAND_013406 [Polypedilum vanderplanki]
MVLQTDFFIDDLFEILKNYVKWTGISLFEKKAKNLTKVQKSIRNSRLVFSVFCLLNLILMLTSICAQDISMIKIRKPVGMPYFLNGIFIIFKIIIIIFKKTEIIGLISDIKDIFQDKKIKYTHFAGLMKYIKYYRRFCEISLFGVLIRNILTIISSQQIDYHNAFLWIPYILRTGSTFSAIIVSSWVQVFSIYVTFLLFISEVTLFTFINFVAIAFEDLNEKIENSKILPEKTLNIKEIIAEHLKIIRLKEKVTSTFKFLLFIHFLQNSSVICALGLQIIRSNVLSIKIMNLALVAQELFQILILCSFGQKIINSSGKISNSIFESCDWNEKIENQNKQTIIILMLKSQKENCIKSLGFGVISLEIFVKAMENTYVYIILLQAVTMRLNQ